MKTSATMALFITKPRNFVRKPQKFNMEYCYMTKHINGKSRI